MAEPTAGDEIRRALERPHEASRATSLIVPASSATGAELKVVKNALDHPPSKADGLATAIAVVSTFGIILKILGAEEIKPADQALLLLAAGAMVLAVYKFIKAFRQKHPFHDQAKEYVASLIAAQDRVGHPPVAELFPTSTVPTRVSLPTTPEEPAEVVQETQTQEEEKRAVARKPPG
jgi:hypothetical protein